MVRPLPIHAYPLPLLPQPALSQVPGAGARPVAPTEEGRVVAHRVFPRGLHAARTHRRHRLLQPRDRLRNALPHHRPNPAHHRPRSPTSGRGTRLLRRAPHLGTESALPSSPALRGSRRRPVGRCGTLDRRPSPFPPARARIEPPLPPSVPGSLGEGPCRRKTPVLRPSPIPARPASVRQLPGSAAQAGVGGLRQSTLRRTATRPRISRPLH